MADLTDADLRAIEQITAWRAEGAGGMTRDERARFARYLERKQARPPKWEHAWESWLR